MRIILIGQCRGELKIPTSETKPSSQFFHKSSQCLLGSADIFVAKESQPLSNVLHLDEVARKKMLIYSKIFVLKRFDANEQLGVRLVLENGRPPKGGDCGHVEFVDSPVKVQRCL